MDKFPLQISSNFLFRTRPVAGEDLEKDRYVSLLHDVHLDNVEPISYGPNGNQPIYPMMKVALHYYEDASMDVELMDMIEYKAYSKRTPITPVELQEYYPEHHEQLVHALKQEDLDSVYADNQLPVYLNALGLDESHFDLDGIKKRANPNDTFPLKISSNVSLRTKPVSGSDIEKDLHVSVLHDVRLDNVEPISYGPTGMQPTYPMMKVELYYYDDDSMDIELLDMIERKAYSKRTPITPAELQEYYPEHHERLMVELKREDTVPYGFSSHLSNYMDRLTVDEPQLPALDFDGLDKNLEQ